MFYRARYYDPSIGRFTQRDPIGLQGGINQYAYTNDNPVNYTDPFGLKAGNPASIMFADANKSYISNAITDIGQTLQAFGQRVLDAGRNESFADTANKFLQGLGPEVGMAGAAVGSIKAVVTGAKGAAELPAALRGGEASVQVYSGVRNGEPVYVGITNNVARRQVEHGERFVVDPITTSPVTRGEARAIEQAVKVQNPGFENIRNSINPKHSWYDDAVNWGRQWLKNNGIWP